MMRYSFYLALLVFTLFSCKDDNMKYLPGKWRAVLYQNRDVDSLFAYGQLYIDTMGKGNDDQTNIRIYGTANMDSMRKIMQQGHDEAITAQKEQVNNMVFSFLKDGKAIISFGGRVDTNKWTVDNENNVIVETMDPGSPKEILKWKVRGLSKNELKLRFMQETDSTIVTFKREEN
jgi:hypothetical protein